MNAMDLEDVGLLMNFESITGGIDLLAEHYQEAVKISNSQIKEAKQWQAYLNALAMFAFEEWLAEREPNICVNQENCSLLKPEYANLIPVVSNLEVGDFQVCLIATGIIYEWVTIPRAVIDLPEFAADFYVLLDVEEELEIASIRGFFSYGELQKSLFQLKPESDWSYQLPLAMFEKNSDNLLLYLRCLSVEKSAVNALNTAGSKPSVLAKIQGKLTQVLPELQRGDLWEFFDWEEGATILKNPDLVRGIYHLQKGDNQNANTYLFDVLNLLTQRAVNVANWVENRIDEVGESLSWNLLPAMTAMRQIEKTPTVELADILTEIEGKKKTKVPPEARSSYRDFQLGKIRLRLYAVTWSVSGSKKEWNLLSILTRIGGEILPEGIKLRVSDNGNIITERELKANGKEPCYARVVGNWNEKFLVTIATADNEKASTVFEWKIK